MRLLFAVALAVLALLLVAFLLLVRPAWAGSVRCTTYEVKSLNRLKTLCDDGTRAVSMYNRTLNRWETTITESTQQACTAQVHRPRGGNYPTERVKARAPGEGGRPPSHRPPPPSHLGAETAEALHPVDRLRAPSHEGGATAPCGCPRAKSEPPAARDPARWLAEEM